jgi:hypothetical protein
MWCVAHIFQNRFLSLDSGQGSVSLLFVLLRNIVYRDFLICYETLSTEKFLIANNRNIRDRPREVDTLHVDLSN